MAEKVYPFGHTAMHAPSERTLRDKVWDYLRGFAVILSDIVLCCLVFMLIPLLMHWDMALALRTWTMAAALQLLIGNWMVSFSVSWSVYLAVQGAAVAAVTAVTVCGTWFSVYETDMRLFLAACTIVVGMHSAFVSYQPPGSNGIMRFVDLLIAAAAFYLYAVFQMRAEGDRQTLTAALIAMVLNLLTVNHLRTGGEGGNVIRGAGAGSKLALAGILAGCLLITGMIVGMASGQVHSAVDLLLLVLQGIYQVLSVIFGAIGRVLAFIILFLVAVFPAAPPAARENASEQLGQEMETLLEETGVKLPPWVLGAIFAAVLLILAGWVLYQLRDVRIQRASRTVHRRSVVRKSHLLEALTAVLRWFWERLVFEWEYLRHRNSPQGLLVLAERIGRRNHLIRRPDESPGAYIRRFAGVLEAPDAAAAVSEASAAALEELAELLDQIFYAGKTDLPETFDCRRCAEQIRSCFCSST